MNVNRSYKKLKKFDFIKKNEINENMSFGDFLSTVFWQKPQRGK